MTSVPRLGSGLPLVARADELAQLTSALARARAGSAGAVLLSGDAGVGKSRVLAEFTAMAIADGAKVLTGHCLGMGDAGLPYLPFTEVVEQLRATQPDLVAGHPALEPAAALPTRQDDGEHNVGQLRLFDAVLGVLTELSTHSPVVLAIEDLHWADPSTRDLLSFLFTRLGSQRLLVVATYRSDDMHRQHPLRPLLAELLRLPVTERLDLKPFDPPDAQGFARALLGDEADGDVVATIAERSEGNAFFAEELAATAAAGEARRSGDRFAGAVAASNSLPWTLTEVLLARLEQLSPAAQRVVRAVSVTGRRHVRHSTVSAVLEMAADDLETALREAVQHHVLVPSDMAEDAYTFRHALLREAVYNDLLPGERVRLHTSYAKLATKQEAKYAESLAYHARHSNDLPTALRASVQAASNARDVGALAAELRHLEQALELWDAVDDPEEVTGLDALTLHRKAGYAASAAGHPERAVGFCRAALAIADREDDPVLAADVRRQLAQAQLGVGRWSDFEQTIAEAWQLIKDEPASKARAWVLAKLAMRGHKYTDFGDDRSLAEAAIADARESGSASAEVDALITLAYVDTTAGRIEEACDRLEQARLRAVEADAPEVELRAIYNLAVTRGEQGRLDVAADVADSGARRAAELGLTWSPYGLELRWSQVLVHYARGAWDDAAEAAAPPGDQVSDVISALIAAAGGLVQVARGRFGEAERMLARVRPQWERDSQIAQLAGVAGAELACWQGRPDVATDLISEAIDVIRKSSHSGWPLGGIRLGTLGLAAEADLAEQARHRRDTEAEADAVAKGNRYAEFVEQTAEHGRPRAGELGPEGLAWLTRMRAERQRLLGESDPERWREVINAFGYGEPYPQALAQWRLAEALIGRGDREAAAAEVGASLAAAEKLGAEPLADACRELSRRARLGSSGARSSVPDTLTQREMSVLRLVADGHTNRQIGAELFISEKTVSVHVSRVMSKLGATSRTEAVAIAYQRGLLDN
ncbi:MAG TPA: AAA family ATPase [Jiangellaceae bacterium]